MSLPMSDKDFAAIVKRVSAATAGPWKSYIEGRDHESGSHFIMTAKDDIEPTGATHADQDFMAEARQDIPRLLAEIRRLKMLAREPVPDSLAEF